PDSASKQGHGSFLRFVASRSAGRTPLARRQRHPTRPRSSAAISKPSRIMTLKRLPFIAPFHVALLVLAAAPALASNKPSEFLNEPGLSAAAHGRPLPVANLPRQRRTLEPGAHGKVTAGRAIGRIPEGEFGAILEFDGSRAEHEASGIRVNSQVGNICTVRMRSGEIQNLGYLSKLKSARLARYVEPNLNVSMVDVRGNLEHGTPAG